MDRSRLTLLMARSRKTNFGASMGTERNPEALTLREVELLVMLAIRIVRVDVGASEPERISITSATLDQRRECWDIYVADERDNYYFIVPTDSPEQARLQGVMSPTNTTK